MTQHRATCLSIVAVFLLSGCRDSTDRATRPPSTVASSRPATAPASRPAIPVIYVYPDVAALSAEQLQTLTEAAASARHLREGCRPWFIAVHQNRETGCGKYYRIMLYLAPDAATGRVRTGRFLQLWWWTGAQPVVRDYVQVSRRDRPFGEGLDLPAIADLPFEIEDFNDLPPSPEARKWTEFIDFARPLLEKNYKANERLPPYLIRRNKTGDLYAAATGTDEGGDAIMARWTPDGFALDHEWAWSGSPWGNAW